MPQIAVGSSNIIKFGFSATVDIHNRSILFDTSTLTAYAGSSGSGIFNVIGIAFSLVDQDGVELMGVDWAAPQIVPSNGQRYTLDLSSLSYVFLFQNYKTVGYIKDASGTIYSTDPVYKKICQPVNLNDSGYVDGLFQVIPDCVNNTLTVKELTVLTYNNATPQSTSKSGNLFYPTGTISQIPFTGTPFTNNVLYTGEYRIVNTTIGTYAQGDDVYVLVSYLTGNTFSVTCTNRIADLLCCIEGVQATAVKECNNALGAQARQKLADISPFLMTGLLAEINGQDASEQADYIKKALRCNCGATSIHQNEMTPLNPSIYGIMLQGVGGTTIPAPTIVGTTKTFYVASNVYQVTKGNTGDAAFTITTDTSTANTVKYVITFNYAIMAGYILTAFENDQTYIARLRALMNFSIDLTGLNGKCVIDTTSNNYTLQVTGITSADLVENITIGGIIHLAPANLHANDAASVQSWLNTLTLGTFSVGFGSGILTVTSNANTNVLSQMTFLIGGLAGTKNSILFQQSAITLLKVLQALIDYLCNITALKVALGNALTLWQIDYSGNLVSSSFTSGQSQNDYNIGLQNSIYNIIQRIGTLTGVTCNTLKAIFVDRPSGVFGTADRVYGTLDSNCSSLTDEQLALVVFNAVSKYSNVKTAFCAINCGSPATCPDVSAISLNMSGVNIGLYGISWANTTLSTQVVTVKYKLSSSATWLVATNALNMLPNGSVSGTSPFLITGVSAGSTYDVQVVNNCGGVGFSSQITVPTGTVYSASYYLENSLYLICGRSPVTLYSSVPFGVGVTLYTNVGLTTPVTGYHYVTLSGFGIYNLGSTTGVVGSDTGNACTSGTAGLYRIGNTLLGTVGTGICFNPSVTYYTNGVFTVGGTLYQDVALTTPVTGYAYVVNLVDNQIYNLNSVTGAIGATTSLFC